MPDTDTKRKGRFGLGSRVFGSRIARLIFASNLAGLAILIVGAMVLNEMRAGFVVAKKEDLEGQAQIFSNLLNENATIGRPAPALQIDPTRDVVRSLNLPASVRAVVSLPDGEIVGDSFFLSERVDVRALPPVQEPGAVTRLGAGLSDWMANLFSVFMPERGGDAVRTQSYGDEFAIAVGGGQAASQRFSDRGQRVISVSVPIQHVSAVVGVLTVEASDIDEIIRAERAALFPFIAVAVLVAFITSSLLTLAIARPLRHLAISADRVRAGSSERLSFPKLTGRRDEIGQLAKSMESMTAALFERIVANERFAADVAHELKNPLTSIRSAVETVEHVQGDPVAVERLHTVIAKDVQRLDRLITDISNASRLEAEITRIPTERLDIGRFVGDIVSTYESVAEDGSVRVRFSDETMGAGLLVKGREGPLGQVFRNLIDNARSFSPAGGEVRVTLSQAADGPRTLARITIDDDGPGIPEDKFEKIFERFYTDRPAGAAFGNNSGLGLSIVKQIIETHTGTVTAANREEGGACFTVDLRAV